jgi:hypothetical protein
VDNTFAAVGFLHVGGTFWLSHHTALIPGRPQ